MVGRLSPNDLCEQQDIQEDENGDLQLIQTSLYDQYLITCDEVKRKLSGQEQINPNERPYLYMYACCCFSPFQKNRYQCLKFIKNQYQESINKYFEPGNCQTHIKLQYCTKQEDIQLIQQILKDLIRTKQDTKFYNQAPTPMSQTTDSDPEQLLQNIQLKVLFRILFISCKENNSLYIQGQNEIAAVLYQLFNQSLEHDQLEQEAYSYNVYQYIIQKMKKVYNLSFTDEQLGYTAIANRYDYFFQKLYKQQFKKQQKFQIQSIQYLIRFIMCLFCQSLPLNQILPLLDRIILYSFMDQTEIYEKHGYNLSLLTKIQEAQREIENMSRALDSTDVIKKALTYQYQSFNQQIMNEYSNQCYIDYILAVVLSIIVDVINESENEYDMLIKLQNPRLLTEENIQKLIDLSQIIKEVDCLNGGINEYFRHFSSIQINIQDLEQIDYSQRANIRCVPKSLVQVVNLPSYLKDQTMISKQLFGRYGKIRKIIIKQIPIQNTCQAYVTYQNEQQALDCIYSLNETWFDNHLIKCQRGTSKFCNSALNGKECTNPSCQFIHSIQEQIFIHNSQDNQCKIKFNEIVHPDRFQAKLPQGHQHVQNKITYEDNQSQSECFPPSYLFVQTAIQDNQLNNKNQLKYDKKKMLKLFGGYMIGENIVI